MPIRLKEAVNQSLRMCINQMSGVAADGGWTGYKHHTCSLGPSQIAQQWANTEFWHETLDGAVR